MVVLGTVGLQTKSNVLPDIFDSYFKPRNEIHNLQIRNAHKLDVIRVKNSYGKSTLKYKGMKMYNELPNYNNIILVY